MAQEVFYNEANTQYIICEGGEDSNCADQFGLQNMKPENHLYYVNVHIECDKDSENENNETFIRLLEVLLS